MLFKNKEGVDALSLDRSSVKQVKDVPKVTIAAPRCFMQTVTWFLVTYTLKGPTRM